MQSTLRSWILAATPLQHWPSCAFRTHFRPIKLNLYKRPDTRRSFSILHHHQPRSASTQPSIPQRQWKCSHQGDGCSDTIYALSTPAGRAAVAVIRISGPACLQVYRGLCPGRVLPRPRHATLRKLQAPGSLSTLEGVLDPGALLLYFPAPKTATGEDVLELHTHGGPAIVKAVLKAIPSCTTAPHDHDKIHKIRYAEPGEFTKRAFYNDRIDLTQVESLSDSLSAETEQQRRLAVQGTASGLAARYNNWRDLLLRARAELEALIDFSEDQDFDESADQLMSSVSGQVMALKNEVSLHIENASKGELLRNGISIALLGAPNAGKSSLLNTIVGREAAIVSSEVGTTRDIVDVSVDIGGWLCRLGDMAGLRKEAISRTSGSPTNAVGPIEREGMRRAKARALTSDVVVVVVSLETPATKFPALLVDEELMEAVRDCESAQKPMLLVVNKVDHLQAELTPKTRSELRGEARKLFPFVSDKHIFAISCVKAYQNLDTDKDPGNIQEFLRGLHTFFAGMTTASSTTQHATDKAYWEESLSISHRQSRHLEQCREHASQFLSHVGPSRHCRRDEHSMVEIDLAAAAEHLRFAGDCLSKITGKGAAGEVEEVLGVVFEK